MIPKIPEEAFVNYSGFDNQRVFVYLVILQAKNLASTM